MTAAAHNIDIAGFQIVSTEHSHAAAAKAVAMARSGEVEALMKGALHTDELMHEVVASETGLRTSRRISHVFAIDAPAYPQGAVHHRRRRQYLSEPRSTSATSSRTPSTS